MHHIGALVCLFLLRVRLGRGDGSLKVALYMNFHWCSAYQRAALSIKYRCANPVGAALDIV